MAMFPDVIVGWKVVVPPTNKKPEDIRDIYRRALGKLKDYRLPPRYLPEPEDLLVVEADGGSHLLSHLHKAPRNDAQTDDELIHMEEVACKVAFEMAAYLDVAPLEHALLCSSAGVSPPNVWVPVELVRLDNSMAA